MLNRFVLDKSHLRMRHDMWFSTFSGACILHEVFAKYQ